MNPPKFLHYFLAIAGLFVASLVLSFLAIFCKFPAFLVLAGCFASTAGCIGGEYFCQKRLFAQSVKHLAAIANVLDDIHAEEVRSDD